MSFTHDVAQRYGIMSETIKDKRELEQRLDRSIKGLETEIGLKQANCERLIKLIRTKE